MRRNFTYKKKFSYGYLAPVVVFIVLAVCAYLFKYGIAIKNLRILAYPNSFYILCLCAVLFIVSAWRKFKKAKDSAANPNPIIVDDNGISFPKGKTEIVTVSYTDVKDLLHYNDNEDGKQVIIYTTDGNNYEFSEEYFENPQEFSEFEKIMEQNCTNITNKSNKNESDN